jgi:hypothetical protein
MNGQTDLSSRSTADVVEDHLRLRLQGNLDADLLRNYSEYVVLLTMNSNLRGHEAIRHSAARLAEQLPNAKFEITATRTAGAFALLVWRAVSDRCRVECGADSFIVRQGKIQAQTIHYRLLDPD